MTQAESDTVSSGQASESVSVHSTTMNDEKTGVNWTIQTQSLLTIPAEVVTLSFQGKKGMAGNINRLDLCSKGVHNEQFHMEMHNVAAMKDKFISLTHQESLRGEGYIPADANSRGSVLSLKQHSDIQPLTEWHACRYEDCMKFHSPIQKDPESPASHLKNVFFYLVIMLLVAWVLVYTVLSKMHYI